MNVNCEGSRIGPSQIEDFLELSRCHGYSVIKRD